MQLSHGRFAALTPLAGLQRLHTLWLSDGQIIDIAPLAMLPALRSLVLRNNPLADITLLARLPALEYLDVGRCRITTLSPLSNAPRLATFWAHGMSRIEGWAQLFAIGQQRIKILLQRFGINFRSIAKQTLEHVFLLLLKTEHSSEWHDDSHHTIPFHANTQMHHPSLPVRS